MEWHTTLYKHRVIYFIIGIRPKIWKYLLRYTMIQNTEEILIKKRMEYEKLVDNYWKKAGKGDDKEEILSNLDEN